MLRSTLSSIRVAILTGTAVIALTGSLHAQEREVLDLSIATAADIANFNTTTASVFRLADELGYFERHGVNVTFVAVDGTPQAAAALYSGAVDLSYITIDTAIRLRAENDVKVRGFASVSNGISFLIAAQTDITTVEELAGRSFAINDYGSLDHELTSAVLLAYGMDAEQPAYVAIGSPDVRVQALAAGQVDATTVSFGTYASIETIEGIHVLVSPDEFTRRSPALSKFIVALESTIDEKEEAIQRFTDAIIEASRALQADPEGWVDMAAAARPDLTRDNLERTAGLNETRWCINGCMNPTELTKTMDFIYANPDFVDVPVISYEDITDLSFTTRALEKLGVATGSGLDARE